MNQSALYKIIFILSILRRILYCKVNKINIIKRLRRGWKASVEQEVRIAATLKTRNKKADGIKVDYPGSCGFDLPQIDVKEQRD